MTANISRNAILNTGGRIVPILVGLVTVPYVFKFLGPERFGILSLLWVLVSYFSFFDLGLGRAATKFVAELIGLNRTDATASIVWTTLAMQAVLGLSSLIVLYASAAFASSVLLTIHPQFVQEATRSLQLISFAIPLMMVAATFSGLLEARQRFDLVNAVNVPANSCLYLLPAVCLYFGTGLPQIAGGLVVIQLARTSVFCWLATRVFESLRLPPRITRSGLRPLLTYGGWITVSNIVGPLLANLERFVTASVLDMATTGYYAISHEFVTKVWILPASLVATLFPAFSANGVTQVDQTGRLFARSISYLLFIMTSVTAIMFLFADDIFRLWLGPAASTQSAPIARVLLVGIFLNSLAFVPLSLLQGLGRPDVPPRFHIAELVCGVIPAILLTKRYGAVGAAASWSFRVGVDSILLFGATYRFFPPAFSALSAGIFRRMIIAAVAFLLGIALVGLISQSFAARLVFAASLFVAFVLAVWHQVLRSDDRSRLVAILQYAR